MSWDITLLLTFATLTFLEIILGIDNLIFIALVVQKLPSHHKKIARILGLSLAFLIRIVMLMALSWVIGLTQPVMNLGSFALSWKDILLILGGVFLIGKGGIEIIKEVNPEHEHKKEFKASSRLLGAIAQITLVDFIFSFDSIITAVAMTTNIPLIVGAVGISMIVMFACSHTLSDFLAKYPSLKIIALAFILMVGVILLLDGVHFEVSKTYLYFSLFFTLSIEIINIIARKKRRHHE